MEKENNWRKRKENYNSFEERQLRQKAMEMLRLITDIYVNLQSSKKNDKDETCKK